MGGFASWVDPVGRERYDHAHWVSEDEGQNAQFLSDVVLD